MTRQPLAALRRELQRRGAIFRDDDSIDWFAADENGVRVGRHSEFLWFYDPDGNRMEFCRSFTQPEGPSPRPRSEKTS